ncbi:3-hydroxy-3-methylglutaryl coenzyme A synthase [Sorochytrium milnesiophthora]
MTLTSPPATTTAASQRAYPQDVGIVALDIYFPKRCILQEDLEKHDGVSAGKYTIGLGQKQMAFCDDREDINSICMTVVQSLMQKYKIPYTEIGRLEVGTETIIDKSKSVKTHLMDLFHKHGNTDIEGIATTNACYGGTSALFNAVQWMESSYWDGRYALVIAGDIAIYAKGNARPTSGAGVVAMLIGPNAPLVMERGLRGTYMENAYDFYKPNLASEYPQVDGHLSVECYMRAVDQCYAKYCAKLEKEMQAPVKLTRDMDYAVFHSPYAKIVQKAVGRLVLNDYLRHPEDPTFAGFQQIQQLLDDKKYDDKLVEKTAVTVSADYYKTRVDPSLETTRLIGNMYCASLYGSLLSLISMIPDAQLLNKRILMFSFGSGLAASMFSFRVARSPAELVQTVQLHARLSARTICSPVDFEQVMQLREHAHNAVEYTPEGNTDTAAMWPETWYLAKVDSKYRRAYAQTPASSSSSSQ